MACRVSERLSWSELREQCCYRKFVIRIFQDGNSTVNSLGYKIYVKMFWPENNTQMKHIHFSDWLLDCQDAGSSIYSGKMGFTSAQMGSRQQEAYPSGVLQHQRCALLPASASVGSYGCSSWVMAQFPSWMLPPAEGLCSCFNQHIYSHDTHMLSTSFACRKHPFLDDCLHHALLWYPCPAAVKVISCYVQME